MPSPSSRLVRKEKSRLLKQTLVFIGLAIALLLIFIFVILPLFITLLNKVLDTNPFPEETKVELQTPLLNAPVVATKSAELKLTGYALPQSEVVLLLNAQEAGATKTQDDGSFELPVTLEEGDNVIAVFSRDDKNNTSPNSQEYVVAFDQTAPKLTVDEPQPEARFDRKSRQITVRGLTDAGAKVTINDRLAFSGADGAFSTTLSLQDGKNDLKIVATDEAGNRSELTVTVYLDV